MKPEYGEYLVVGILFNGNFGWYVLDKDLCYMDYEKLAKGFRDCGYEIYTEGTDRFGVVVLNRESAEKFLGAISDFKVTSDELKAWLISEEEFDAKIAFNASILIDFDNELFISYYADMIAFENYVPDGWIGKYECFEEYIPENERYWIAEDGSNLITGRKTNEFQ